MHRLKVSFLFFSLTAALYSFVIPHSLFEKAGIRMAVQAEESVGNPRIEADPTMEAGQNVIWDCLWFGSYPQTEIVATDNYNSLEAYLLSEGDYEVEPEIYQQLEETPDEAWDSSGDTIINGIKYRRILNKGKISSSYYTNWTYAFDPKITYYYFRYDPIKWRVLNKDGSTVLLLADKVLDARNYHDVHESVVWKDSTIRSFLNGYGAEMNQKNVDYSENGFIDIAFSENEKETILETELDNDPDGSENGNNTTDRVFFLANSDTFSDEAVKYGFLADNTIRDAARICRSTTYAKAAGAGGTEKPGTVSCFWWLRNSGKTTNMASCVENYGNTIPDGTRFIGLHTKGGVRPAIRMSLSSLCDYAGAVESRSNQCLHPYWEWRCDLNNNCVRHNVLLTRYCGLCGATEEKIGDYGSHNWGSWYLIEESTPWSTGLKRRICLHCHYAREEKIILPRPMTIDEKEAYTTLQNFFTYAKSYKIKKMNACFTSKQPSSFFTDNKYMASYCRKYNKKKLKVTPVDITVNGNKATMIFTVTYPDAYKPLLKACEAMNWNGHSYHTKKGQAKMKAYVKKYTKKYGVKKTTKTIKIHLKKTRKKGWKISSSSTAIKNAINCNYRTAFKDAK